MKLIDIAPMYEAYEQDYSAKSGTRWSPQELQLVFQAVKKNEASKEEISQLARTLGERDDFDRTTAGAEFALNRMHILIHGVAPEGETESRAEKMFAIPSTMTKFAEDKGYDPFANIKKAKAELKGRPVRVKPDVARKMMSDYYKANKASLPKDITKSRDAVIKDLMVGMSPKEAFDRHS